MRHFLRETNLPGWAGLLTAILLITGCVATLPVTTVDSSYSKGIDKETLAQYPKASADATLLLNLQSNIQKTTFYIDGKEVATGRRVKILVNNLAHTVTAVPEGYISKEEFIQPPYHPDGLLGFTFMIGEKLPAEQQRPSPKQDRLPPPSIPAVPVKTDQAEKKTGSDASLDSVRIEQAKKLYYEGNAFFSARAFKEAVESYKQALSLETQFPPLYYNLAMAQIEIGQKGEAVGNLKRYLELRPDAQNAAEVKKLLETLSKPSSI